MTETNLSARDLRMLGYYRIFLEMEARLVGALLDGAAMPAAAPPVGVQSMGALAGQPGVARAAADRAFCVLTLVVK